MIDDGCHASYHSIVAESHEILTLTALKRRVPVTPQRVHLVKEYIGNSLFAVSVQIVIELHELAQFPMVANLAYLYVTHLKN